MYFPVFPGQLPTLFFVKTQTFTIAAKIIKRPIQSHDCTCFVHLFNIVFLLGVSSVSKGANTKSDGRRTENLG